MTKPSWLLALGLISSGISAVTLLPVRADCLRAVKIIVPQPPGGPDDLIARILAQRLSQGGSRFYVENMPGATGMIGAATAARAAPDGCTLIIVNQNLVTQPAVGAKNPYSVPDDFTPVTLLLAAPETISVNPSVPAKTMQELIALAKANPGKYNYATPGYGSSPHLAGERLFAHTLGLDKIPIEPLWLDFNRGHRGKVMGVAEASILLGLAIVLIAVIYGLTRMQCRIEARHEVQSQKLARNEIATIVERSGLTGWGALRTVVFLFAAIIGFFGGATATTVFQQIEASISLISTLILFGIAFAVLRKRTYSVYRSGTVER